jgi:hypothetical protein
MNNETAQAFLNAMKDKIDQGDYDSELGPFQQRKSLFASLKARIDKKLETGGTPILSEAEIKDAFKDAKEVAAITLGIFKKLGIIKNIKKEEWEITPLNENIKEGWVVTPLGEKILKLSSSI